MRYRPEIDGLRAVAVLPVILYHASVAGFDGGFVGVDVFFVISGYLISSIVMEDIRHGRFSLVSFYERRVRRIFPALFAMLAATWVAGYLLLLPLEMKRLSLSLRQATLFYSNIGFWRQSGYFDVRAETKPLLHTWSLCVEEQFYLLFPLLLLGLWRWFPRRMPRVLGGLIALSFALAVRAVSVAPEDAFYFAQLRAWELMLGSVVALNLVPSLEHGAVKSTVSLLGLLSILTAVFGYSRGMAFPGFAALLPTLGAAAFIHAESRGLTWLGRLVAHRALVSVGLISYALYLWHWPALVYARMASAGPVEPGLLVFVLCATCALAVGSRYLLEEPFRKRRLFASRRGLFGAAALSMATTCLVAWIGVKSGGLPRRLSEPALALLQVGRNPGEAQAKFCVAGSEQTTDLRGVRRCDVGDATASAKTFLVWGDSHAQSLTPAASMAALKRGLLGTVVTRGGCPPAVGIFTANQPDRCSAFHRYVMDVLDRSPHYENVILIGRWGAWLERRRYEGPARVTIQAGSEQASSFDAGVRLFERRLAATLTFLQAKGKHVSIVGPVPEADSSVPNALARSTWRHLGRDIRPSSSEVRARQRPFDEMIARLHKTYRFEVVEPAGALCKASRCDVTYGGASLYFDEQHLIATSAPLFAPLLSPLL